MLRERVSFMSPDFLIRAAEQGDERAILAAFAHVFKNCRSRDIWQWIYRDNPDGSQSIVCLSRDGEVAAHSGATFHRAVYDGETIKIGQCRDAFSQPKFRSVLQERVGLFAQTTRSLFAQYGIAEEVAFYYGFPSSNHLRLGCKQLDYREANNWGRFRYNTRKLLPDFGNTYGSLSATKQFGVEFDRLWLIREKNINAAVVHDSRFLSWRFHSHSKCDYWVWTFTPYLSTEMTGYVIFLQRGHQALLLDTHLPAQTKACFDFWMQIVEKLCWHGVEEIETLLSFNHPDLGKLREIGFVQYALPEDIKFCYRLFDGGPGLAALNEKFCFSLADSDLY